MHDLRLNSGPRRRPPLRSYGEAGKVAGARKTHISVYIMLALLAVPGLLPARAESRVVTDALDRVVSLPRPPQRIVAAGKASIMLADALHLFPEARPRMAARATGMLARSGAGDFLELLAGKDSTTPVLPGNAGLETLAALRPDAVLLKSFHTRLGDELQRLGIPVLYLDFETPDQYGRDLATLGRVLDAPDRARSLADYYRDLAERVARGTAALPDAERPRTLLLQYAERSGAVAFSVPPVTWMQTRLVEMAGGQPLWKNAGGGGWTVVNLEQIAAWDPDCVFVVNYAAPATRALEAIAADATWQNLRAFREGRIHAVPGDFYSWDQPDTRWGLGLLWLATRLHPDRFREVDLESELLRFYALYGLDEAAVRRSVRPLIHEPIGPR